MSNFWGAPQHIVSTIMFVISVFFAVIASREISQIYSKSRIIYFWKICLSLFYFCPKDTVVCQNCPSTSLCGRKSKTSVPGCWVFRLLSVAEASRSKPKCRCYSHKHPITAINVISASFNISCREKWILFCLCFLEFIYLRLTCVRSGF